MDNASTPINPIILESSVNELGIDEVRDCYGGLTKREYFAGLAMQGMLANDASSNIKVDILAQSSVMFSDALLKALKDNK